MQSKQQRFKKQLGKIKQRISQTALKETQNRRRHKWFDINCKG